MSTQAFTRLGNTVAFVASTSAPTPVQAAGSTLGANQYRVVNKGATMVFLGVGATAADATSAALVVTAASAAPAIPIMGSSTEVITALPNAYFTGITESGSGTVFITPGDGL